MNKRINEILKTRLGKENHKKLLKINNPRLHEFIAVFLELLNPSKVFVCSDSKEDIDFIRKEAIKKGEEERLSLKGHTIHFDGYYDQARDKERTKFLVPGGKDLGPHIRSMDREEGLSEIQNIMKNIMHSHTLYILFFCLGPTHSEFSIPSVQLTDSSYVAHSELLLYRRGYEEFRRSGKRFFKFVHSEGEVDERKTSRNTDKRRIYIDLENEIVYSANTQYGGNTIGLKKLAMRLAINRASREDWLTEHMFLMGVHGPNKRTTYFTGAFPSLCGKTSTSMVPGETIVGDDISYLKKINHEIRAVNVEKGMFGIIMGVNSKDDPTIWKVLHNPGEIIFSNVLVADGKAYWMGMDKDIPERGRNHSGEWTKGKKDREGNEIPPSHPNARFTLDLGLLDNLDTELDNPEGVRVGGIIYGGRDSDTWVPVKESLDWKHGVVTIGSSLESETTAATLGKTGIRKYNPMANLDFLSIPVGKYIQHHLNFVKDVKNPPKIFAVNYFLKDSKGEFLNEKTDKAVWLKWMELRSHGEVGAIRTPTGLIPKHEDLEKLFKQTLKKEYSKEEYSEQFKIRAKESLEKIERITDIYKTKVRDTPKIVFRVLEEQKKRLEEARNKFGDYILPGKFL